MPKKVGDFLSLRWIGVDRIIAYSRILLFASVVSLYWIFQEAMGPDGSDFLAFWSAGKIVLAGNPADAYDLARLGAIQQGVGQNDVFAFVNPPPFLLGLWPLGYFDYPIAWIVWVAATYLLWLKTSRKAYPKMVWPISGFPGALIAAWHAQTGFLTSALQTGAAARLQKRPFRAGLCIGILIIKPHLALLFPFALLAGRHWRAIGGAAVSVVGLLLAAWAVFGTATMLAYTRSWAISDDLISNGSEPFFLRQVTVYALVRSTTSPELATVLQTMVSLGAIALIMVAWSRPSPLDGKLALLFAATPLVTPYLFSYDLPFLILPICWMAVNLPSTDFGGWKRPALLLIYVSPLVTRAMALPLGANCMPVVSLVMTWLIWRTLRRNAARGNTVGSSPLESVQPV